MECAMARVKRPSRGPSLTSPPGALFLTIAQVCERMQLSRPTVVGLIHEGQLKAVKVGRHWRISTASVESLTDGHGAGSK